jgi:D-arabinitol 4-dehydrogenase
MSNFEITSTNYNKDNCKIGFVHLGFGAFHRAHQAVYIDDYMDKTRDLSWGIAAVNLRKEDSDKFNLMALHDNGYLLKTTTPKGIKSFRMVRSHISFSDWSKTPSKAENLLGKSSVKAISITVTESGYYLNSDWSLDVKNSIIQKEINGLEKLSIYAYLCSGLKYRMKKINEPVTVICCDNIRSNGDILKKNFYKYLELKKENILIDWLSKKASFPNSMIDRITPRSTKKLHKEVLKISNHYATSAINSESFIQWVLEKKFASSMPALNKVDVELVDNVNPYEEAKIRILNGGHTALCYLGALSGYKTFDEIMTDQKLCSHFYNFETENVLPAIRIDLPFDKYKYRDLIAERFSNKAIEDDLSRICMDGWSKFPIFIRPTIEGCLDQNISPKWCYESIASWYIYARRFCEGKMQVKYIEPYWDQLEPLLKRGQEITFSRLKKLWGNLPDKFNEFSPNIQDAILRADKKWPS